MKRFRDIFLSLNIVERISFIVGQICAIFVIVFGILQITNVWGNSITICEIFLGILMITQAILQWKKNKGVALFSLCTAIFIFVIAFIILFIR